MGVYTGRYSPDRTCIGLRHSNCDNKINVSDTYTCSIIFCLVFAPHDDLRRVRVSTSNPIDKLVCSLFRWLHTFSTFYTYNCEI
ncbi:hypothetical protein Mapa_007734 [Marchantia paleacea]|nr:hypothetical protein Mapa_007734 [Marchantia paleacea]